MYVIYKIALGYKGAKGEHGNVGQKGMMAGKVQF